MVLASQYVVIQAFMFPGANDYVSKPFSKVELLQRIRNHLALASLWHSEVEARASEALLRRLLPDTVMRRLKAGENNIGDKFDDVTIMFVDIMHYNRFLLTCNHKQVCCYMLS